MTKGHVAAQPSSVPLGSRYQSDTQAASPNRRRVISTRDNIGAKVVEKPSAFKTVPRKRLDGPSAGVDGVGEALGRPSRPVSPSRLGASTTGTTPAAGVTSAPTMTANKAFQLALKNVTAAPAAPKKRVGPASQLSGIASLAGEGAAPAGGATSGTTAPATHHKKMFTGCATNIESATNAHASFRDPNDPRFVGAAGVPSRSPRQGIKTVGGVSRINETSEAKPEDPSKFHKRGIVARPAGDSHLKVMAGGGPVTEGPAAAGQKLQEQPIVTGRKLVAGRSTISPYRGTSPQRGVSPVRHSLHKPYATVDAAAAPTATGNGGAESLSSTTVMTRKRTEISAANDRNKSLVGVFKPDDSVIKPRAATHQAPWEVQQSKPVSAKGRCVSPSARQDHMAGVFTSTDVANGAPTGAAVGSSNIMGRVSPFRGATTATTVSSRPAAGASSEYAEAAAARRSNRTSFSAAASANKVDTRPVWKQTPRTEIPRASIGGCRRQAGVSAAPWATD